MALRPFQINLEHDSLCVGQKVIIYITDTTGEETSYTYAVSDTSKATILANGDIYSLVTFAAGSIELIVTAAATDSYEITEKTLNLTITTSIPETMYVSFANSNWDTMGNLFTDSIYSVAKGTKTFSITQQNNYYYDFLYHDLPILKTDYMGYQETASISITVNAKVAGYFKFYYSARLGRSSNTFTIKVTKPNGSSENWVSHTASVDWTSKSYYMSSAGTYTFTFSCYRGYSWTSYDCIAAISHFEFSGILPIYFLVKDGNNLYTFNNNNELELLSTKSLTATTFYSYGVNSLPYNLKSLLTLTNPQVVYWWNSNTELPGYKITIYGYPVIPQIIYTDQYARPDTATQIRGIDIDAYGDILYAFQFDNEDTWEVFLNGLWVPIDKEDAGIDKNAVQEIPLTGWASKQQYKKIKIRCALTNQYAAITTILIKYM